VAVDFSQEIKDLRTTMASVREVTDLSKLEATIADFEQQASTRTCGTTRRRPRS
jgi:peptide chain release factor 2